MSAALEMTGGTALRGTIRVPGDKSISHRALLLAARAEGTSTITGLSGGDDVQRTKAIVGHIGADVVTHADGTIRITGGADRLCDPHVPLDVGNSGTAIRLLTGFLAAFPWTVTLAGDESIAQRPMDRIAEPLGFMGAQVSGEGPRCLPPITVEGGKLRAIEYRMPIPSAQVKSAILLAGLGADGETVVRERLVTRVHTEELLELAGADITWREGLAKVRPGPLHSCTLDVPGDPSQAAFWVVAAAITPGSEVTVEHVYYGPARAGFVDVLRRMGADIEVEMSGDHTAAITTRYRPLRGTKVEPDEIPGLIDEVPVLAVAAAVADGVTVFEGAEELRVKETDRIATIESELGAMGARVEGRRDTLTVPGGARLHGAAVQTHGDHRIGMAMAIAALVAEGETTIEGWEAVATSYPGFAEHLEELRA